jgi:crossover junction endodeoxyribonuclease RuvC
VSKKSERLIFGVDPGTAIVGWGLIAQSGNRLHLVGAGCVKNAPALTQSERLVRIFDQISALLKRHTPDVIAVEQLFFAKNVTTGISVAQARGVILLAAARAGVRLAEYRPMQIKQSVCGYARADKRQVQEMVKRILNLKEIIRPDDAADALAAAICHANSAILEKIKVKE